MTLGVDDESAGHAFISYVREDRDRIRKIVTSLQAADVPVWTDKDKLAPGDDWRLTIRRAIQRNSLAFIAVFSKNSEARSASYQNEELTLAIEQFRQRLPGRAWIIPVRLDECEVPDFDLGAGRTLNSLQRVDLFGDDAEEEMIRLVTAVLRILGENTADSAAIRASISQADKPSRGHALVHALKATLLEPARQIEVEEILTSEATRARDDLKELFEDQKVHLVKTVECARQVAGYFENYWSAVEPLGHALVATSAWGRAEHTSVLTRVVRLVSALIDGPMTGSTFYIAMREFPVQTTVLAASLAAVARKNYAALKAVAVDPVVRYNNERLSVISRMAPYEYVYHFPQPMNLLAVESDGTPVSDEQIQGWIDRGGLRYTPASDYMHNLMRPLLAQLVPDDLDYDDLFDETDVLLGVLAEDARLQGKDANRYLGRPGFGRYTWRDRHNPDPTHRRMQQEAEEAGDTWPPLAVGLFGGSAQRAAIAFESYCADADQVMSSRW